MDNRQLLVEVGKGASTIFTSWEQTASAYIDIYKEEIDKKNAQKK